MAIYTNEHLTDLLNDEYEKVRKLEQELQKTREQLEKAEKLLFDHNNFLYKTSMVFSSSTAFELCKEFELYREKYLKDKDKQGE